MVDEAGGTHEETVEAALRVERFYAVEDSGNDVVAAGSLAAGKYDAHVEGLFKSFWVFVADEFHYGKSVSIRETLLYLLLVGHRLGGLADLKRHRTLQCFREFRNIIRTHSL